MKTSIGVLAAAATMVSMPAMAQDWYVSGSLGVSFQTDSQNTGTTGAFTTGDIGDGSTIDVTAGTSYGWETAFEDGYAISLETGLNYEGGLRSGIELAYTSADVKNHARVTLNGGNINDLDAATLTGSATAIGADIGTIVADGQGDVTTTALFLNAYYDFNSDSAFQPYVGVGIGVSHISVDYSPSGVSIIDESETKLAYQGKFGLAVVTESGWDIFGEYTYRGTEDVSFTNRLFPGDLSIETRQSIVSGGVRFKLG